MPSSADIIRDSINEFSRLQNWMLTAKSNNDMDTYNSMYDRYIELKVTLTSLGVNITKLDKINEWPQNNDSINGVKAIGLSGLCTIFIFRKKEYREKIAGWKKH